MGLVGRDMPGLLHSGTRAFCISVLNATVAYALVRPCDLPSTHWGTRQILGSARRLAPGWRLLLAGALLATGVATYRILTSPTRYVAETLVAIAPATTAVQFEPSIESSADPYVSGISADAQHRQALVDLATSSRVEGLVRDQLGSKLPSAERQPGALLNRVHVSARTGSEIISIQTDGDFSEDATLLANMWGNAYVREVNRIYSSSESLASLEAERDAALQRRQNAQKALVTNLQDSRLDQIGSRIRADEDQLAVQYSPQDALDYQALHRSKLNDLVQTARRFDAARFAALAFINLASTDPGAVDGATLALLSTQIVTLADAPDGQRLQVRADPTADAATPLGDLVRNINATMADLRMRIGVERADFEAYRGAEIKRLEKDLRELRAEYEASLAKTTRLTADRDLTDETYQALARKAEERRVADISIQRQLEIASPATRAVEAPAPVGQQVLLALGLGCAFVVAGCLIKRFIRLYRPRLTPAPAVPAH